MEFAHVSQGLRIEAHLKPNKWMKGTVVNQNIKLKTVEIMLEDNTLMNFQFSHIRSDSDFKLKKQKYDVGDRVLGKFNPNLYYEGTIQTQNRNHSYTILFDDGDPRELPVTDIFVLERPYPKGYTEPTNAEDIALAKQRNAPFKQSTEQYRFGTGSFGSHQEFEGLEDDEWDDDAPNPLLPNVTPGEEEDDPGKLHTVDLQFYLDSPDDLDKRHMNDVYTELANVLNQHGTEENDPKYQDLLRKIIALQLQGTGESDADREAREAREEEEAADRRRAEEAADRRRAEEAADRRRGEEEAGRRRAEEAADRRRAEEAERDRLEAEERQKAHGTVELVRTGNAVVNGYIMADPGTLAKYAEAKQQDITPEMQTEWIGKVNIFVKSRQDQINADILKEINAGHGKNILAAVNLMVQLFSGYIKKKEEQITYASSVIADCNAAYDETAIEIDELKGQLTQAAAENGRLNDAIRHTSGKLLMSAQDVIAPLATGVSSVQSFRKRAGSRRRRRQTRR